MSPTDILNPPQAKPDQLGSFVPNLSLLDNDVLETSKRRVMLYNILSQIFIVKCFTKSLLIRIFFCLVRKRPLEQPLKRREAQRDQCMI